MAAMTWVPRRVRSVGLVLTVATGLGTALGGSLVGAPALASGKTGGSRGETGSSPTPVGVWCSTLDRPAPKSAGEPVELTAGVGSTQSTPAGAPFPIRLAVTVTDAQKNPVPSVVITFSAPLAGASGRFAVRARGSHDRGRVSHPRMVKVDTNACGIAVAPAFTANDTRGGYIVKATVRHARPAAFALVNLAPGQSS